DAAAHLPRPFRRAASFRVRSRRLVLALRRRRLAVAVYPRLLALASGDDGQEKAARKPVRLFCSAQATFSDPSEMVADEKKGNQACRKGDPYGECLDHARTLAAIVVEVIERGAEAEHNKHQRDDDDNANQGSLAGSNERCNHPQCNS